MNRLLLVTALSLFLGLDASHAQTSLHKQRVDEQIDETSCASANWLSRTAQLAELTLAYKWYDIAAAIVGTKVDGLPVAASHNGEKDYSDQLWYRDQVAKHMTSEQIAEAQKLARDWKPEQ